MVHEWVTPGLGIVMEDQILTPATDGTMSFNTDDYTFPATFHVRTTLSNGCICNTYFNITMSSNPHAGFDVPIDLGTFERCQGSGGIAVNSSCTGSLYRWINSSGSILSQGTSIPALPEQEASSLYEDYFLVAYDEQGCPVCSTQCSIKWKPKLSTDFTNITIINRGYYQYCVDQHINIPSACGEGTAYRWMEESMGNPVESNLSFIRSGPAFYLGQTTVDTYFLYGLHKKMYRITYGSDSCILCVELFEFEINPGNSDGYDQSYTFSFCRSDLEDGGICFTVNNPNLIPIGNNVTCSSLGFDSNPTAMYSITYAGSLATICIINAPNHFSDFGWGFHLQSMCTYNGCVVGGHRYLIKILECKKGNDPTAVISPGDQEPTISIYPNPNNGKFNITWNNGYTSEEVVITDNVGKQIYRQKTGEGANSMELNLSHLAKGMYIVMVIGKNGEKHLEKIIIQ